MCLLVRNQIETSKCLLTLHLPHIQTYVPSSSLHSFNVMWVLCSLSWYLEGCIKMLSRRMYPPWKSFLNLHSSNSSGQQGHYYYNFQLQFFVSLLKSLSKLDYKHKLEKSQNSKCLPVKSRTQTLIFIVILQIGLQNMYYGRWLVKKKDKILIFEHSFALRNCYITFLHVNISL